MQSSCGADMWQTTDPRGRPAAGKPTGHPCPPPQPACFVAERSRNPARPPAAAADALSSQARLLCVQLQACQYHSGGMHVSEEHAGAADDADMQVCKTSEVPDVHAYRHSYFSGTLTHIRALVFHIIQLLDSRQGLAVLEQQQFMVQARLTAGSVL